MIRKRILLASLLKPVTDTRLYEKIGKSLAKLPQLEVHVAGFAAPLPPAEDSGGITFHPIFHFKRLSPGRLVAQRKYLALLNQLKPELIIVGTHELLLTTWLYCRQHKAKLVYDVQENYHLNLTTQGIYRYGAGQVLGKAVRWLENTIAPKVDHFLLAEESYGSELPFLENRYTVLPNKYQAPQNLTHPPKETPVQLQFHQPLRLLYSGTISKIYGVLEAIKFTTELRQWAPQAELTIAGYCADASFLQEIRQIISPLPYIKLIGGDRLLPHRQILELEQAHHVGLLPYRPHPSTFNCLPTKLFEYQANALVIVAQKNPLWQEVLIRNSSGVSHSFSQAVDQELADALLKNIFYTNGIPQEVFWQAEKTKVQEVIFELLTELQH